MSLTATTPAPLPIQPSTIDESGLAASMRRHPSGKRQVRPLLDPALSYCPTCGQRPSGALGDPALSI